HLQQQQQNLESRINNGGHQGHCAVHSSQRPHTTSDDDIIEHEDFVNDASTKIVQNRYNDQLTEEAERLARTRYPCPPFIVRFPSSNIKEQKVSEELCKHLKDNKQLQLELIGYRRSTLNDGKLRACSISFPVVEYLAQARVLICGKCCSIGHFRRQCRQNCETCRTCRQAVSYIKQHLPLCSKQPHCIHCKQNHASDDMRCSEVKNLRANLTRRLLNSNNGLISASSSPGYLYDQSNFPRLPYA
ncbi:unnamed protein product, partial [Rotaria sp. Silwood1]